MGFNRLEEIRRGRFYMAEYFCNAVVQCTVCTCTFTKKVIKVVKQDKEKKSVKSNLRCTLTLFSEESMFSRNFSTEKNAVKKIQKTTKQSTSQCGNFGNFPPLQKFFVNLIYIITL